MADYIFNVYLHTDRGEFSKDYSLSEYTYNLPPFYFSLNEYVSAKATIDILNSVFSCSGASIYNLTAFLKGGSAQTSDISKTMYNTPQSATPISMTSEALVQINTIKYTIINDKMFVSSKALASFNYA